jgi:hypothetical protein
MISRRAGVFPPPVVSNVVASIRSSIPEGARSSTYMVRVVLGTRTSASTRRGERTTRSTTSVSAPSRVTNTALSTAACA